MLASKDKVVEVKPVMQIEWMTMKSLLGINIYSEKDMKRIVRR